MSENHDLSKCMAYGWRRKCLSCRPSAAAAHGAPLGGLFHAFANRVTTHCFLRGGS